MSPKAFKQDIKAISEKVGVEVKEIHLRKMSQKWAGCSSKGRLTFDPELLERPKEERLKAVLHDRTKTDGIPRYAIMPRIRRFSERAQTV